MLDEQLAQSSAVRQFAESFLGLLIGHSKFESALRKAHKWDDEIVSEVAAGALSSVLSAVVFTASKPPREVMSSPSPEQNPIQALGSGRHTPLSIVCLGDLHLLLWDSWGRTISGVDTFLVRNACLEDTAASVVPQLLVAKCKKEEPERISKACKITWCFAVYGGRDPQASAPQSA